MTRPEAGAASARPAGAAGGAVPILVYHDVSPEPTPAFRRYSITVSDFARQMAWLAERGYQAIDLDALVAARSGRSLLPERPIVITFDDGFQGCADHGVPVLQAHGFTAVFYLVAGSMGQTSRWMAEDPGVNLPLMSWDTARRLAAAGFQCGVHTMTHPRLTALPPGVRRAELVQGRRRLEDELGRPAVHLAYPYGAYDPPVRLSAVEAGFASACSTRPGRSAPDDDLMALHRLTVYGHDSLADFAWRVRAGAAPREWLGRTLGWMKRRVSAGRDSGR